MGRSRRVNAIKKGILGWRIRREAANCLIESMAECISIVMGVNQLVYFACLVLQPPGSNQNPLSLERLV